MTKLHVVIDNGLAKSRANIDALDVYNHVFQLSLPILNLYLNTNTDQSHSLYPCVADAQLLLRNTVEETMVS